MSRLPSLDLITRSKKSGHNHRSTSGRPTREQARLRHEQLLDEALEQFLDKGFVMTTIDAIAAAVGMTKRTVYTRYPDKNALFGPEVQDRKSDVEGKSVYGRVDLGGRRSIKKKRTIKINSITKRSI